MKSKADCYIRATPTWVNSGLISSQNSGIPYPRKHPSAKSFLFCPLGAGFRWCTRQILDDIRILGEEFYFPAVLWREGTSTPEYALDLGAVTLLVRFVLSGPRLGVH